MTFQKKLLVLVDGTERSIQTIEYLKNFMPVDENTRIVLFHVLNGMPEAYREVVNDPMCEDAANQLRNWETVEKIKIQTYLERAKKILTTGGFPEQSIEIKLHCLENGVARDIIREAGKGYDAVILRRRGMGELKSILLGSVAVKLLQSLTFIPIIIVGQAPPAKKILLAVDGSSHSMKAVEFTARLLGNQGYGVCIFHAIPGLGAIHLDLSECNQTEYPEAEMRDTCFVEAFKLKVGRMFQGIKEKLTASGFESEKISEKLVTGVYSRSEAIVKEAEDGNYGAIVVGRRGLSRVEAFFMGRVGHKVVYGGNKFTVWVV